MVLNKHMVVAASASSSSSRAVRASVASGCESQRGSQCSKICDWLCSQHVAAAPPINGSPPTPPRFGSLGQCLTCQWCPLPCCREVLNTHTCVCKCVCVLLLLLLLVVVVVVVTVAIVVVVVGGAIRTQGTLNH